MTNSQHHWIDAMLGNAASKTWSEADQVPISLCEAVGRLISVAPYIPGAAQTAERMLSSAGRPLGAEGVVALAAQTADALADSIVQKHIARNPPLNPSSAIDLVRCLSRVGFEQSESALIEYSIGMLNKMPGACRDRCGLELFELRRRKSELLFGQGRIEEALNVVQQALESPDSGRQFIMKGPDPTWAYLADSLTYYSIVLFDNGLYEDSLEASERGCELYRQLASGGSILHLTRYAVSRRAHAVILCRVGRCELALRVAQEAAAICEVALVECSARNYSRALSRPYERALAEALDTYSVTLSVKGKDEAALEAAVRASLLHKGRGVYDGAGDVSGVAGSLRNASIFLSRLGRRREALKLSGKAMSMCEELTSIDRERFLPDLARSAQNFSTRLAENHRRRKSLRLARMAVDLFSQLNDGRPNAYRSDLAKSFENLALRLTENRLLGEANNRADHAATIYEDLSRSDPDAYRFDLARTYHNYSIILFRLRDPGASGFAERSESMFRQIIDDASRDVPDRSADSTTGGRGDANPHSETVPSTDAYDDDSLIAEGYQHLAEITSQR